MVVVASFSWRVSRRPAAADEAKSVQVVGQNGRDIDFLVYLAPEVAAASPGVDVTSTVVISGVEVPSEATPVVEVTAPQESILVLDVSGSMRGERLAAAKEAAINYVNGVPDDVEIGLVSFNDTVTVDVRPTRDKEAVIRAINGLTAGRRTALWDGMITGLDLANPQPRRATACPQRRRRHGERRDRGGRHIAREAEGIPIDIVALTPTVSHAQVLRNVSRLERRPVPPRHRRGRPWPGVRRGDRCVRRQGRRDGVRCPRKSRPAASSRS